MADVTREDLRRFCQGMPVGIFDGLEDDQLDAIAAITERAAFEEDARKRAALEVDMDDPLAQKLLAEKTEELLKKEERRPIKAQMSKKWPRLKLSVKKWQMQRRRSYLISGVFPLAR